MIVTATTRTHLTSDEVAAEIDARLSGTVTDSPIPDGAALAIASWYASPVTGRAFAALATTGSADDSALYADMQTAMRDGSVRSARDHIEMIALMGWISSRAAAAQ